MTCDAYSVLRVTCALFLCRQATDQKGIEDYDLRSVLKSGGEEVEHKITRATKKVAARTTSETCTTGRVC